MEQTNKRKRNENDFSPVKKRNIPSVLLKLPNEIWSIIIREVPVAFSLPIKLTCSFFRSIELNEKRNMDKKVYRNKKVTFNYAKWAVSVGFRLGFYTTLNAVVNRNLKVLKWLHENGCPWDERACRIAAANGNLEALKYLHENGCPWDEYACFNATINGNLEVLKYLHKNGCHWNENACYAAALNGHLEVLKYLQDNGCPWDKWSCLNAANNGHLKIVIYLHENGCPWDEWACFNAAYNGHLKVLKWLHDNGCPCDKQRCIKYARKNNHKKCLEYLLQIK